MTHNEIRIFGPPGCGKTTRLKNLITEECKKNGSEGILVASYTKAAAQVLVERDLPLDSEQVNTLHSHCYRMLGNPELALKKELREEFNRLNRAYAIAPPRQDGTILFNDDQEKLGKFRGEEDFRTYEMFRARMVPRGTWPTSILAFAQKWEEYKEMTGSIDFTDMIENCLAIDTVPFGATAGFFDEVQDFSALELSVIRHWNQFLETCYLAADDDQALYFFRGANATDFLNPPLPPEQKIILEQSYRLPQAIHAYATDW